LIKRKIKLGQQEISYTLKKRKGQRRMKLAIYPDGYFTITAPKWYPIYAIENFLREKAQLILEKLGGNFGNENIFKNKRNDYLGKKEEARKIILERIEYLNQSYKFSFKRVAIKNQRTCWGSCSRNKNLNFNYRVARLPNEERDYVVVHELCHLQELNHGKNFWQLVEKTIPEYKKIKKKIRKI